MMTTMSTKHSSPASVSRPLQTAIPSQRNNSVATFQTFSPRYHTVTCVLELCAAQVDSESNNSSLGRASRTERSGAERSRTAADDLMRRRRDIGLQSPPATRRRTRPHTTPSTIHWSFHGVTGRQLVTPGAVPSSSSTSQKVSNHNGSATD